MYINVHLQPMERRLVARRQGQVCWLDAGKDFKNCRHWRKISLSSRNVLEINL